MKTPDIKYDPIIIELEELVSELPVDWVGTGGGSYADRDAREWRYNWDQLILKLSERLKS